MPGGSRSAQPRSTPGIPAQALSAPSTRITPRGFCGRSRAEASGAQANANPLDQLLVLERLADELFRPRRERALDDVLARPRGDDEYRHVSRSRILLQRAAEIEAVAIRHRDVEKDEIRDCVLELLQCRRGAGGDGGVDSLQLEQGGEEGDDLRIVVHHQDAAAQRPLFGRAHSWNSASYRPASVSTSNVFGSRLRGAYVGLPI